MGSDLWVYDFQNGQARELLADPQATIGQGALSNDGNWLAYASDESGSPEIFVRSFPALDRKWKISQGGGLYPHWRNDDGELLFVALADHSLHAVAIHVVDGELEPGVPELLFTPRTPLLAMKPAADHTRLLAGAVPGDVRSQPIRLMTGWIESSRAQAGP